MAETPTKPVSACLRYIGGIRASIGQKIAVTFLVVLCFAVANIGVVKTLLSDFGDVVVTVNVAGKLRMLSQRLAFQSVGLAMVTTSSIPKIQQDIIAVDRNLQLLKVGGVVAGSEIRPLRDIHQEAYDSVVRVWQVYRADLMGVIAHYGSEWGDEELLLDISRQNGLIMGDALAMLQHGENLTTSIVQHSQKMQSRALNSMYILLLADTLVLLLIFLLARKYMVLPLRELAVHSRALMSGNYDTRVTYQSTDEIGHLGASLNCAAAQIGQLVHDLEVEQEQIRQSSAMFMELAANTVVGVYIIQGRSFRFVNQKMATLVGYDTPERMMRSDVLDMFREEDRAYVQERSSLLLQGEAVQANTELRVVRQDNCIVFLEFYSAAMMLDGQPTIMGVAMDVTQRKESEAASRLAAMVYESSSQAMVVTDEDTVIVSVNPAFATITGYQVDEVIGQKINILSSGRQDQDFYRTMWHSIVTSGRWEGDIWNRRKNGEEYAERMSIDTSYKEDGSVRFRIGLFTDVTKKKKSDAVIWKQANYDHLTGLPNRQLFHDRLAQAIARSRRSTLPLALVFLDLDFFKEVNDTLGHDKGDELLRQVSKRLSGSVRATDTVARMGGDEFIIIMSGLKDITVVERVCQKILQDLSDPYVLGQDPASISASLGVAFYPQDASDAPELLKSADLAMYAAKELGRNQYAVFTQAMRMAAQSKRQLSRDLYDALKLQQLVLHYQPIVNLFTGQVYKAEALVRWQHPVYGEIGPGEFIPFAEDSGLIIGIGDWVFREAARQAALWRQHYQADFQVSVNVSPAQFSDQGLDQQAWLQCLQDLGLPGDSVVVEITERLLMDVGEEVINKLLAFRDAGVQVSLDDFGTGYSSLSYLRKFDIDYIKIDQSFVRNLSPDSDDLSLCEAMIVMAHRLGLKVIAEGIETPEQYRLLVQAGCDYGQGYLFSRPVPVDEFTDYLRQNERHRSAIPAASTSVSQASTGRLPQRT
ncbi:MAG: EAL domain-containing protein [Burkholderiaceae bacterium]|nr:EAL domain-containing protein [Burkholderiaceae bacterium]